MKISVFGLVFLAALFCSLQAATAASISWTDACKIFVPPPFSKYCDSPPPGTGANAGTENGSGNAAEESTGAARSLPIIGSLPFGNLIPLRSLTPIEPAAV